MRAIALKLKPLLKPDDTQERCGLILDRNKVVETDNTHPDPSKGFLISATVMHKHAAKLKGTWHTHPGQSSVLSQDDYLGFANWPGIPHYIVGTDGVRCYIADSDGVIQEAPCT